MTRHSCLVAVPLCLFALACAHADNWPQWRGPTNDGISTEKNLPSEWSTTKNVVWKLDMPGIGSSTPAIWGQKIFVTSADGNDLVLICVSTEGKEQWKKKIGNGDKFYNKGEQSNNASPSPSTDGKNVWAYFGTGDLACYDVDGSEKWHFNVQDRYGKFQIQWGIHNSPLVHEDTLYLELLHANTNSIVALDKATGEERWKIKRDSDGRGECKEAYTSPVIWSNGKESLLIVHGNDYTTAHQLKDGSEVWRVGDLNNKEHYDATLRLVATPVATADLIVVPTAKGGPVVGIKPGAKGLIKEGSEFESWRISKTPDVPSPLVYDGLVYLCYQDGRLACLDAKSGKEQYSTPPHGGIHRASPVYADGKVYVTAKDEPAIRVVKAGPKYELLATNKMDDTITASPAISEGRIYLRTYKTLYAIGNEQK